MTLATWEWFWSRPSWHWSYAWAAAFLVLPSVVALVARLVSSRRPRPFVDSIAGLDGRWSTSKAGVVLWTAAIWFAFLAILFHTHGDGIKHAVLKSEYFVVLGIPAAAAVAAKGITMNKIGSGEVDKPQREGEGNPVDGFAQIVTDDKGRTDLLDFQYFGFNLILLGFFWLQFFGNPDIGLPNLPDTLLALTGVSAASYVAKKGLAGDAGPTIRSIVPSRAARGVTVRVLGVNLATVRDRSVTVVIGGIEATTAPATVGDAVTEVQATVPDATPRGRTELVAIAFDGRATAPSPFEVA
jgi:hypothetical protein